MTTARDRKAVISWALYDWANSAFACTVMAAFFPVFFTEYWSPGVDATVSTFRLGAANSLSSVIVAAFAPALGAIADRGSAKKRFLLFFAVAGILATGSLYFVAGGDWGTAAGLYVVASVGFAGGNVFYDSLLVSVGREEKLDFVSALGYSLGYLGGGLLFALNVAMALWPQAFGLADESRAVRASFLTVGAWWAAFSVPLFLFVGEPKRGGGPGGWGAVAAGLRQLRATFREVRRLRTVVWFLLGYWLYIDGVDTIVRMAVAYGSSIRIGKADLVTALLITQFVGFPAAIVFGKLGERSGAKTGILLGLVVYLGVTVWGFFMSRPAEFYGLAVTIGLVQGGVQSLSRSFYTRIIPRSKAAEFFGFYNMLGKFAAVIGPLLMGWVGVLTGNPRHSVLSIALLFLAGGAILFFVDEREGRRAAGALEHL